MREIDERHSSAATAFQTVVANTPSDGRADFWREVRQQIRPGIRPFLPASDASRMEVGLSTIATLNEAPPRTTQCAPVMLSSPMPSSLRTMLENREFGHR